MTTPDSRLVHVRTSSSARDFWCRPRENESVSPDFRVRRNAASPPQFDTPFGRQQRPVVPPVPPTRRILGTSREVEKRVLQEALHDAENIPTTNVAQVVHENSKLKADVARLRAQLRDALRINHALASAMARNARGEVGP